jgi:hypothetical protein
MNEKVTIKQKKIMIHNISRYLMTLVALFAMTAGAWAQETATITLKCGTTEKTYENVTLPWSTTGDILKAVISDYKDVASNIDAITGGDGKVVKYGNEQFKVTGTFSGEATVVVSWYNSSRQSATITVTAPGPLMTLNEAKTVATMESMPTSDVTVDYELVRDMTQSMTVTVQDAQGNSRFRVQKAGENSYAPVGMDMAAVTALFNVHDDIENADLTLTQDYIGRIFPVNAQGQPQGDGILLANFKFAPGKYIVKAYAVDGSTYDGTTEQSNTFELFQGFEVQVAANSFATYYKDEALTIDESTAEDAALYTISEVTATEAVLSDEIEAAPKNTPLLIFNSSDKAKTIMLIPTNEPNLALTVAPEFKGTVTAKTFSEADMEAANFYVLTDANAFVWVKGAGQIAANKCWLQIKKTAPNNTRAIVFDNDATAISDISGESGLSGDWYDISGRKVSNSQQPKTKGLYINGGRKVVIK